MLTGADGLDTNENAVSRKHVMVGNRKKERSNSKQSTKNTRHFFKPRPDLTTHTDHDIGAEVGAVFEHDRFFDGSVDW